MFLTLFFTPLLTRRRQHLSTSAQAQTVKKSSSDEVERIIWEEKDNDHQVSRVAAGRTAADSPLCHSGSLVLTSLHLQVLLHIEEKLFAYLHQALFREDNGKAVSDTRRLEKSPRWTNHQVADIVLDPRHVASAYSHHVTCAGTSNGFQFYSF